MSELNRAIERGMIGLREQQGVRSVNSAISFAEMEEIFSAMLQKPAPDGCEQERCGLDGGFGVGATFKPKEEQLLALINELKEIEMDFCGVKGKLHPYAVSAVAKFILAREENRRHAGKDTITIDREEEKQLKEICICAAVKTECGKVIRGHRHCFCFQTILYMGLKIDRRSSAQGFITSRNRFVSREEGRKLQDAAGIPSADLPDGYKGKTLFSEDLY